MQLTLGAVRGRYTPALRRYLFVLHRVKGRSVEVDGRVLQRAASLAALSGCSSVCWASGHNAVAALTYIALPAGKSYRVRVDTSGR